MGSLPSFAVYAKGNEVECLLHLFLSGGFAQAANVRIPPIRDGLRYAFSNIDFQKNMPYFLTRR